MISVIVCAEVRLYRDGLVEALDREQGLEVVATAASGTQAAGLLEQVRPDAMLIDVSTGDGLETLRRLRLVNSGATLLALGLPEQEDGIIACAEAGVSGFVTRETSLPELVGVIESAVRGEVPCSPQVAGALVRRIATLADEKRAETQAVPLTTREAEILELIKEGLSNKQIAERLYIELATVKNHVHSILAKLKVSRRGEAVARVRTGL
jgi:DNA-binding NarL/FixJ family response regulator